MTPLRKRMVLASIAVLSLVSASSAYTFWKKSTLPISSPATSTATLYPLELRVELNKTVFQQGELINPKVYLRNVSNRTIHVENWKHSIFLDFKIIDQSGKTVYQFGKIYFQFVPYIKDMKANEELVDSLQKTVVEDSTHLKLVPAEFPHGTYQLIEFIPSLVVTYLEPSGKLISTDIALEDPPITILVIQKFLGSSV